MYFSFFSFCFSECTVDDNVLLAILMNERSMQRDIGYKYLISLNNKKDQKVIRKINYFKKMMIDSRTIDCKDTNTCVKVLSVLFSNKIKNLDIGPYQVNSIFHLDKFKRHQDLFHLDKSKKFACNYVMSKIKRLGYSWNSIGAYHSETEEYNIRYTNDLIINYKKIIAINKLL